MNSGFDKSGGINVYGDKIFSGDVTISGTLYNASGVPYVAGGGGGGSGSALPGGINTQVQFNDAGTTFGGAANLTYNKTTGVTTATTLTSTTLTGSTTTGSTALFTTGRFINLTGALNKLSDGTNYLLAGTNVTLSTGANGAVTITSTGGGGGVSYFSNASGTTIYTTSSNTIFAGNTGITSSNQLLGGGVGIILAVTGGTVGIYDDLYVVGGLYDGKTQKQYTTAISQPYTTSSNNNSSFDLHLYNISNGDFWVGDIFVGAKTTYLSGSQSQIWVGVVGNVGSATGGSIDVNGNTYPISTDPNTWAAGILSSESATLQSFVVDFINGGNDMQLTITAKPGASVATVSNLNFTGPGVTNSLNSTQAGADGVSTPAYASIKLSNCFCAASSSNSVNSGSYSIITDASNVLQNITASLSSNNPLSVSLTGLNGYTVNWSAYAVGQKVI